MTTYIWGYSRSALQPILHCRTITTAISITEYHGANNEIKWKLTATYVLLLRKCVNTISIYLPFNRFREDEEKKAIRDLDQSTWLSELERRRALPTYQKRYYLTRDAFLKINEISDLDATERSIGEIKRREKETKRKKDPRVLWKTVDWGRGQGGGGDQASTFSPVR